MQTPRNLIALPLMLLLGLSSFASAGQRHVVDPAALASTVAEHAAGAEASRSAVRDALSRPEVQRVADQMGIDLTRAKAAIDTLEGADLDRAAAAARQLNDTLVGGASTIVISTTTIIIILLVVILIIVAVK